MATKNMAKAQGKLCLVANSKVLAKTFSWKVLGVLTLFIVSYMLTGSPVASGTIALTYHLLNTVLYYLHEKAWEGHHPSVKAFLASLTSFILSTLLLVWLAFPTP